MTQTGAVDELRELYRYTWWANDRILDAAAQLTSEQLHQDLGGSFPSVWLTLRHMAAADRNWHRRWLGEAKPSSLPAEWPGATLDELRREWTAIRAHQAAFLEALHPAMLDTPLHYTLFSGISNALPLREVLRHVVNHGTYHRGQVSTFLRRLGVAPPGTDLLIYYATMRDARRAAVSA